MLARIEARNQLEHTIYYCKEAAENRGSERLSELADKVALWLEVSNFLALLVQVRVLLVPKYLCCWYKSTNTDAEGTSGRRCCCD